MKRGRKEMHWVLRSQSGDTDALNSLLNAIQEPIYRYIVGLVNDEHMAYDILQEVFLVVTRKIYWVKDARLSFVGLSNCKSGSVSDLAKGTSRA